MNQIAFLRLFAKVSSLLAGGCGFFLAWAVFTAPHTRNAPWLACWCTVFIGSAVLILWLRQMLPEDGPPRKRGKGLLDRLLNALD